HYFLYIVDNILEIEMPENLLDNSDNEDCCSTDSKASKEEEYILKCQSGKKRESSSNLKYSQSKLKKPRTLPIPTSLAKLRSPLATVNRSVNLISNSKLTQSTSKKLISDNESITKKSSIIPSLLSKNENLCQLRMPSSVY